MRYQVINKKTQKVVKQFGSKAKAEAYKKQLNKLHRGLFIVRGKR